MRCPRLSVYQNWTLQRLITDEASLVKKDGTLETAFRNLEHQTYEWRYNRKITPSLIKRKLVRKIFTGKPTKGYIHGSTEKKLPKEVILLKITEAGRKIQSEYDYYFEVYYKEKMAKRKIRHLPFKSSPQISIFLSVAVPASLLRCQCRLVPNQVGAYIEGGLVL